MAKLVYKAALADLVLLVALYFVLQDLAWRAYYSGVPHAGVSGYAPSSSYSVLIRYFAMAGSAVNLTSPSTLDWVQLLGLALVVVNAWLAYGIYRSRAARAATSQGTTP
jgi:hypothetical protein